MGILGGGFNLPFWGFWGISFLTFPPGYPGFGVLKEAPSVWVLGGPGFYPGFSPFPGISLWTFGVSLDYSFGWKARGRPSTGILGSRKV